MRWESLDREHCSLARALAVRRRPLDIARPARSLHGRAPLRRFRERASRSRGAFSPNASPFWSQEGMLRKIPYQEKPTALRIQADRQGPRTLPCDHFARALGRPLLCRRQRTARPPHTSRHAVTISARSSPVRNAAEALDARAVTLRPGPGAAKTANRSRSRTAARR